MSTTAKIIPLPLDATTEARAIANAKPGTYVTAHPLVVPGVIVNQEDRSEADAKATLKVMKGAGREAMTFYRAAHWAQAEEIGYVANCGDGPGKPDRWMAVWDKEEIR